MDDFRSVVQANQTLEFTNVFGSNKGGNLVTPKSKPDQVADPINVIYFSRVFVIWRPYELCPRCTAALNAQQIVIGPDEDYTCPHNNNEEYERVVNKCLTGEALLQKQEFFNMQEGTRCVHIMWMIADPKFVAEAKKKREAAAKDKVYPPNPAKVFQEEYDKKKETEPGEEPPDSADTERQDGSGQNEDNDSNNSH
jgi:hypothetical protein